MAALAVCPTCRARIARDAAWCAVCFERFDCEDSPAATRAPAETAPRSRGVAAGVGELVAEALVATLHPLRSALRRRRPAHTLDLTGDLRPDGRPVGLATSPSGLDRSPVQRFGSPPESSGA